MFFEKNAAALSKIPANKLVADFLRRIQPAEDLELYTAADNSLTVKYHSIFLHDTASAVEEARQLCDKYCDPGVRSCHILFGLGLGYLLREARNRTKGKIVIYEPNLPLLRYVLDNVDLSQYFATSNTYLTIERKQFALELQSVYTFGERFEMLVPRGYIELMGEEINDILKNEVNAIVRNERNGSGISMLFQDEWVKHFVGNIPFLPQAHILPILKDRYTNKPALLISAGPSLDDAIPTIKRIADRVVIIAIGRTLKLLLEHGIQPDFVTFLDYEGPYEQLQSLPAPTDQISFILGPFANHKAFETPAKHHFTVLTENYIEFSRWYDTTFKTDSSRITSGSSVSLMSLQSAFLMGCNPIILVGQDLAFRNRQIYAGSDQQANITEDGYFVRDDIESVKHYRFELSQVKGQQGEMLTSSPDYVWFIEQFNNTGKNMKDFWQQARHENLRLVNASVGGALLEEFEHAGLDELEAQGLFTPFDKTPVLQSEQELTLSEIRRKKQILATTLQALLSKVDDTVKYAQQAHEQANLMLQSDCEKWSNQHQQLVYFRNELSKRLSSDPLLAYFILSDILTLYRSYEMEVDGLQDIIKNIKLDAVYFEAVANRLTEKFKPWLQEALKTINAGINTDVPDFAKIK